MKALVIGTPGHANATRLMLLGAGELGKEVALEAQRFGVEVIAVDRYANAPAMQVAHRSHVINMLDGGCAGSRHQTRAPAFHPAGGRSDCHLAAGGAGGRISRRADRPRRVLTMDREGIRRLAAEELGLPTSPYRFAGSETSVSPRLPRLARRA